MKVQEQVLEAWKLLSSRERRMVRNRAKVATDAALRNHAKIILSLVAGNGARGIGKSGLCSTSQTRKRFQEPLLRFVRGAGSAWNRQCLANY